MKKRLMVVAALAVAMLVLFLTIGPDEGENIQAPSKFEKNKPRKEARRQSRTANSRKSSGFSWKLGEHASYRFNFVAVAESGNGRNVAHTEVNGLYHVKVVDVTASGAQLLTVFSNLSFSEMGSRCELFEQLLSEVPCFVEIGNDGAIRSLNVPDFVKTQDSYFIKSLNYNQVVLKGGSSWATKEKDLNGMLYVKYEVKNWPTITKEKIGYDKMLMDDTETVESGPQVEDAIFEITIGDFWFDRFVGSERIIFSPGGKVSISVKHDFDIQLERGIPFPELHWDLNAKSFGSLKMLINRDTPNIMIALANQSAVERVRRQAKDAVLRGIPFEEVITNLRGVLEHEDLRAEYSAINTMGDWLMANPQGAAEVLVFLGNDENYSSKISAALVHALEQSGSNVESQAALGTILSDTGLLRFKPNTLTQAAIAAGELVEILDDNLLKALFDLGFSPGLSPDLRVAQANSRLSLGVLSQTFPELRENLSERILPILEDRAADAWNEQIVSLGTLENGKIISPELMKQANQIFKETENDRLKLSALKYLSLDRDNLDAVYDALADNSKNLQIKAVGILASESFVSGETVDSLLRVLNNKEAHPDVREAVVYELDGHADQYPEILESMRKLAGDEAEPESLRDSIKDSLD